MESRAVVESLLACWRVQDVEMAMTHAADDIVYTLFISETALPFAGETRGKASLRNVLYTILSDFDYLQYDPAIVAVEDDIVRVQVQFTYHHRPSGGDLAGSKRMVMTVNDGLITRIDEYHDARMVESFMKLAAQRSRDGKVQPPELPAASKRPAASSTRVEPSS
jgi:ketosteroid isomerase-like protein